MINNQIIEKKKFHDYSFSGKNNEIEINKQISSNFSLHAKQEVRKKIYKGSFNFE